MGKNRPRAYNLVLQHCPPELETRLISQAKWEQVRANRDVVGLLQMIRDIAHNHDENKPGLMAIIECNLELSLGFQDKTQTCDDFMAVFKARVDTINAHRGQAGYHPGHLLDTFDRILEEKNLTKSTVLNWPQDEQDALKKVIEDAANEEYLAVLFIKQADEFRYRELKTTLVNAYLNPNSIDYGYPTAMQDALRLLKGYTSIGTNRRHQNNNENKEGLAFVENFWQDKNCFGCGKKERGNPYPQLRRLARIILELSKMWPPR